MQMVETSGLDPNYFYFEMGASFYSQLTTASCPLSSDAKLCLFQDLSHYFKISSDTLLKTSRVAKERRERRHSVEGILIKNRENLKQPFWDSDCVV